MTDIWMEHISGKPFYLREDAEANVSRVAPWEIALSLAQINRFIGHTRHPEPVARHSRRVAAILAAWGCDMHVQLVGLLHDAPEAFMGDIPSPMIALIDRLSGGVFRRWKKRFDHNVFKALGIEATPVEEDIVGKADRVACLIEHRHHHLHSEQRWDLGVDEDSIPFDYNEIDVRASYRYKYQHKYEAVAFAREWCLLTDMSLSKDFCKYFEEAFGPDEPNEPKHVKSVCGPPRQERIAEVKGFHDE